MKFNAATDWVAKLNKDNNSYVFTPILTYELEKVWVTKKPILFIGKISDVKIKNEKEYTVIISRDFLLNKTNFTTDIELSVTAPKNDIDSLIKNHDVVSKFTFDKAVTVIAKIDSVSTQFLLNQDNHKHEVKTGNGKMLDIQFLGRYGKILNN